MKIKELLAEPESWTQGTYARNSSGQVEYLIDSYGAVSWCLLGAIRRCYKGTARKKVEVKIYTELKTCIGEWNDVKTRTHEDVLNLVTKLNV